MSKHSRIAVLFEELSVVLTKITASSLGFGIALAFVLMWIFIGPLFNFSQAWQNLLTFSIMIATFLMVFLLQRAQSKDMQAINLKLNELIASQTGASNRMLNVEDLSEAELAFIRDMHDRLPKDSLDSHSLEHVREPEIVIVQR